MKHLALSLLALASTLTAQQWPFNLEPTAPFMDVAVDHGSGAPLLLLGLVTDGCGGGTGHEVLVNGHTAYGHPVGTRVRLHARMLLWHDSRRCSDGEDALITWNGGYGSGSIALRHTAPTSMAMWRRGETVFEITDPNGLDDGFNPYYCSARMCNPCGCPGGGGTFSPEILVLACEVELY